MLARQASLYLAFLLWKHLLGRSYYARNISEGVARCVKRGKGVQRRSGSAIEVFTLNMNIVSEVDVARIVRTSISNTTKASGVSTIRRTVRRVTNAKRRLAYLTTTWLIQFT